MVDSYSPLILFDMDGVLLDSAPAIVASLEASLRENSIPVPPRHEIEAYVGPPLRKMLAALLPDYPPSVLEACAYSYRTHNDLYGPSLTTAFPEILPVIGEISVRFRLRVATSKAEHSAHAVMTDLGLDKFFCGIHGTLDPANDSKVDVMRRAIADDKHGNVRQRVVAMVGDRAQDIEAARELGVTSVGVTWGYALNGELDAAGADHIVTSGTELRDVLNSLTT